MLNNKILTNITLGGDKLKQVRPFVGTIASRRLGGTVTDDGKS